MRAFSRSCRAGRNGDRFRLLKQKSFRIRSPLLQHLACLRKPIGGFQRTTRTDVAGRFLLTYVCPCGNVRIDQSGFERHRPHRPSVHRKGVAFLRCYCVPLGLRRRRRNIRPSQIRSRCARLYVDRNILSSGTGPVWRSQRRFRALRFQCRLCAS
jgi:hypothetical protein